MADPKTLIEIKNGNVWPKAGTPGPDENTMAALLRDIALKAASLPIDYSSYIAELLVVGADGSGPTPLSASGLGAIDLGGLGVKQNGMAPLTITGSGVISSNAHLGQELVYSGAGNINLSLNLDASGQLGVSSGFQCMVMRANDNGSVGQVHFTIGSGLALQRPDGFLGIAAGRTASIRVVGTRVWLEGAVVA